MTAAVLDNETECTRHPRGSFMVSAGVLTFDAGVQQGRSSACNSAALSYGKQWSRVVHGCEVIPVLVKCPLLAAFGVCTVCILS